MMRKYIPKFGLWNAIKLIILFAAYFITARFGLKLFSLHTLVTIIWPPTGIALAFLIIYGYDLWPAVTIGAFLVNILTGASPFVALGIAIGNTLEALIGTYLLRRYVYMYRPFERLQDTLLFIGLISLVATVTSASIGVACLLLGHVITIAEIPNTWFAWWIGDTLGALVLTPFLLTCVRPTRRWNHDSLSLIEVASGTLFLLGSNWLIFWYSTNHLQQSPLLYLILFPLIWAGIRFGSRGMTIAIFITSIFAVFSTIHGHGPFASTPPGGGLLFLQIFIGSLAVTFLIFLSIVKERKHSLVKLNEHVDELELALEKISSSDKAKNDFLAILSHELRNPLAPVLSSIELMKTNTTLNPETERLVNIMETHTYTMGQILDDILDISRISLEKFKLAKKTVSLQTVIEQSIQTAEPKIKEKDHTFLVKVPTDTIWLSADPLRLEQILVNLLINAVKYTKPKGSIIFNCRVEEDIVIISIKDNGIGIAPEMIDQIFEPFLQVTKRDMRSDSGLGIGLALTKKLVDMHNGDIVVKSEGQGFGSEFIVTLPIPENIKIPKNISDIQPELFKPKTADKQSLDQTGNRVSQKKYKILVVDDNVNAADNMRALLRHNGHTVETTYDGVAALNIMRGFGPDVVLLDIGLPIMDGYQVARKIRDQIEQKKLGKLTLIALTGYGQTGDKLNAIEAGFDHHLTKPVSVYDIEKILSEL